MHVGSPQPKLPLQRPAENSVTPDQKFLALRRAEPQPSLFRNFVIAQIAALIRYLAFEGLDAAETEVFQHVVGSLPKININDILQAVLVAQQKCDSRKWVLYTRKGGQNVHLRGVFARLVRGIQTFQGSINTLVQCDLIGHAAIPWAIMQMCIKIISSDVDAYGETLDSMTQISEIIARNSELEKQRFNSVSELKKQLSASVIKLYRAILRYLIRAMKYYTRSTASRILHSTIETPETSVAKYVHSVKDAEDGVARLASYVADEDQGKMLSAIPQFVVDEIQRRATGRASSVNSCRKELLAWLNAIRTDDTLTAILDRKQPETCEWIFSTEAFLGWADFRPGNPSILWIHGAPGFGKTFLSARLSQYYSVEVKKTFASFFCLAENESRRDPMAILRCWIAETIIQSDEATYAVHKIYKSQKATDAAATPSDLWKSFAEVGKTLSQLILLVDGYDECTQIKTQLKYHQEDGKSRFLGELLRSMKSTSVHVLLVSRATPEIGSTLSTGNCSEHDILRYEYNITPKDSGPDVARCSREMIDRKFIKKFDDDTRSRIAVEAASRSEGMFLWLAMFGKSMQQWDSEEKLRRKIRNMPTELEHIYQAELNRLLRAGREDNTAEIARCIFRWTLFAVRPLTVREMAEAMTLAPAGEAPLFSREDVIPDDWSEIDAEYIDSFFKRPCGILVQLQCQGPTTPLWEQTVHFPHFSIKEFLLKSETGKPQSRAEQLYLHDNSSENRKLAEICLQYLCLDFLPPKIESQHDRKEIMRERLHLRPFLSYSSKYWISHASTSTGVAPELLPHIRKLFSPQTAHWRIWSEIFEAESSADFVDVALADHSSQTSEELDVNESSNNNDDEPVDSTKNHDTDSMLQSPSPLYFAAYIGLNDIAADLIKQKFDCNSVGGLYGFPLAAAASMGHLETVQLLINHGADVHQSDSHCWTALHGAVWTGFTAIVEYLISRNANVNALTSDQMSPLHLACESDIDVRIIELLLPTVHNMDAVDAEGRTPLMCAVSSGSLEAVALLVRNGADIDYQAGPGRESPILFAYRKNDTTVLEHVLHLGADMSTTFHGLTVFDFAIQECDSSAMELLISKGALRDADGNFVAELVPVEIMALRDDLERLQQLIHRLPHSKLEEAYMGALTAAVAGNAKKSIAWLHEQQPPGSFYGLNGQTLLHIANLAGDDDVVRMLMDDGHKCTVPNDFDALPIHQASCKRGLRARKLVIDLILRGGLFTEDEMILTHCAHREIIVGDWSGSYTYKEWQEDEVSPFSFTLQPYESVDNLNAAAAGPVFSPGPSVLRSLFYGQSLDEAGPYEIHGQILSPSKIAFVKLYEQHGWLYQGALSTEGEKTTFTGKWGSSPQLWHGTFEIELVQCGSDH